MSERAGDTVSDQAVRKMMREGLSDDAIARRTGLSLLALLELRAAAAVEERQATPDRRDAGFRD